jgi:hypothetical protein
MKELQIAGTKKAPTFKYSKGHFSITGCSIPEDSKKLYKQVLTFFEDVSNYQTDHFQIEIKFDYCDTASLKWILNILMEIQKHVTIHNAEVKWYYEYDDAEMLELGEFVKIRIKIPFNLISVSLEHMIIKG